MVLVVELEMYNFFLKMYVLLYIAFLVVELEIHELVELVGLVELVEFVELVELVEFVELVD